MHVHKEHGHISEFVTRFLNDLFIFTQEPSSNISNEEAHQVHSFLSIQCAKFIFGHTSSSKKMCHRACRTMDTSSRVTMPTHRHLITQDRSPFEEMVSESDDAHACVSVT